MNTTVFIEKGYGKNDMKHYIIYPQFGWFFIDKPSFYFIITSFQVKTSSLISHTVFVIFTVTQSSHEF